MRRSMIRSAGLAAIGALAIFALGTTFPSASHRRAADPQPTAYADSE